MHLLITPEESEESDSLITDEIDSLKFEVAVGRLLDDLQEVFSYKQLYEYYIIKQKVVRLIHYFEQDVGSWPPLEEMKDIIKQPCYRWRNNYKHWFETL